MLKKLFSSATNTGEVAKQIKYPGVRDAVDGNTAVIHVEREASDAAGAYPITPASDILHELSKHKQFGVVTFQAEDEIAGIGAALGASFGGALAITTTSGPGIALKSETIGLAVSMELPLVVIDIQRGGPSTGLPTKTEQSDLYQAVYGRNGDAPLPVIAARSPADAFECGIEAVRIAVQYMTPVMLLTDGYIANAAEPWAVPDLTTYDAFPVEFLTEAPEGGFKPYGRDEKLKRPWVKPGTPGLLHRIGAILRGHHRLELHLLLGCERQELVGGLPDLKRPFRLLAAGSDGIEGYSVISQGAHDLRLHPHALFMSLHGSIEPRTRIRQTPVLLQGAIEICVIEPPKLRLEAVDPKIDALR